MRTPLPVCDDIIAVAARQRVTAMLGGEGLTRVLAEA